MTQVYAEDGRAIPVTVLQAGPCVVVQRKSKDKDGYSAVQLGLVEAREDEARHQAHEGPLREGGPSALPGAARVPGGGRGGGEGRATRSRWRLFAAGDSVHVTGISKGKGFQGVVKRHHFRGGAATHGSMFHRAPGSIGASAFPSRVLKGMRAAGHMGSDRVTAQEPRGGAGGRGQQRAGRARARSPARAADTS